MNLTPQASQTIEELARRYFAVTGNSAAFFRARWVSGQNAVLGNTVSVLG